MMTPNSVYKRLLVVDLVWSFHMDMLHPLQADPWAGSDIYYACGIYEDDGGPAGRTGKTPVIPRSVQRTLFGFCEARLDEAEGLFRSRDAGEIGAYSYQLMAIRDAVLYLLQITSGMRNSESTGVTNDCWRTEVRNGVTYHWVRTRETKTTGGTEVDFLVPRETIRALEMLQRYAQPLQARLADEARWLAGLLAVGTRCGRTTRQRHVCGRSRSTPQPCACDREPLDSGPGQKCFRSFRHCKAGRGAERNFMRFSDETSGENCRNGVGPWQPPVPPHFRL